MSEYAIIMTADRSPRIRQSQPNALAEVLFKPAVSWVVDACLKAGLKTLCVATQQDSEQIKAVLPEECSLAVQKEDNLSSALQAAQDFIKEAEGHNVILLDASTPLVDAKLLLSSLKKHLVSRAKLTGIMVDAPKPKDEIPLFPNQKIIKVHKKLKNGEEETSSKKVISEICWFCADFLQKVYKEHFEEGQSKDYTVYTLLSREILGRKSAALYDYDRKSLLLRVIGRKELLKLNETARRQIVDRLLCNGVNFYCRDGIVIGPDVVIGEDTTIAPGTQLKGHVTIGKECSIGPNTIIEDSTVGDHTTIHSSLIESSKVGSGVRIGPNSHLRPNSVLADKVKIGNFVEIKNSTLGEKTSVAHLTYIGDSDFGSRINVGCGVVTVNYNGYRKFRSCVEDDAFIGCNTNLVSPVHVGRGAYVAAGSTITNDVSADSLAIARARQCDKEGWAVSYREKELLEKQKKQ